MRIFKCTTTDAKDGRLIGWAGSEKEAKALKSLWKKMGMDVDSFSYQMSFVPKDKAGMLAWLRMHTPSTDNG